MPASQWCREKPDIALPVSPLPALSTGAVRFGSFNKAPKLTRETLGSWAKLLLRVPRSTLLLVDIEDRRCADIREAFRANGVDAGRLAFEGRLPYAQFLGAHAQVDVALDPHPYSGATTTIDSLWMGVPVLTRAGSAPISRSTASILETLGMQGWIARSEEELLDLAVLRCGDLAALASLRARLRTALEASPLMQCADFTRQLEQRYLEMWQAQAGPANATR
jgi:predicted O-linked N-acetylglucosamine transferase (SPINDLY family)